MNLQESIIRILREETNYLRMLSRRLPDYDMEKMDEYVDGSINYSSKIFIRDYKSDPTKLSLREFTRMVITNLITLLEIRHYFPNDVEWYEDLVKGLSKHYQKRITSMYNVLKR
jgi:hypothetical protein